MEERSAPSGARVGRPSTNTKKGEKMSIEKIIKPITKVSVGLKKYIKDCQDTVVSNGISIRKLENTTVAETKAMHRATKILGNLDKLLEE